MHGRMIIHCFVTQLTLEVTKQGGIGLYRCSLFNGEQPVSDRHIFIYVPKLLPKLINQIVQVDPPMNLC